MAATTANLRHDPIPGPAAFREIYAHAVEAPPGARLLFVSGQIGLDDQGLAPHGFAAQFELAIDRLEVVLASAGMAVEDLVKLTFFVTRAGDLAELGEIRRRRLAVRPAVTTLVVAGLAAPDLLVEVEAIAAAR